MNPLDGRLGLEPLDLFGDGFTYGMRIAVGQDLEAAATDFEAMRGILNTLHGVEITPDDVAEVYDYYTQILGGLGKWLEMEAQLRYDPTPEERRAGIDTAFRELGHFNTLDAIALRMRISHDAALQLPYMTVWLMLKKDLATSQYERRLNKIHNDRR